MAERTTPSETAYLPPSAPPMNHGSTVAAWFTTFATITGFLVGAAGMVIEIEWLVWTGIALTVLGFVIGKILQVIGYGQGGEKTLAKQRRRMEQGHSH